MQPAFIKTKYLLMVFLLLPLCHLKAQNSPKVMAIQEFQEQLNTEFRDAEASPLTAKDRAVFTELSFFPIDTSFYIVADFIRTPYESPFEMPTTTERKPKYVKYGEAHFRLKGKEFKLDLFQSLSLSNDPEYFDYLFVPFTDKTNGRATYGGGRYLDLRIPKSNKVILDFNQAYNPYCAYNGNYSCPVPPEQNDLGIEIKAGVKAYNKS